ncbi:MAG: hypothetical protein H7A23_02840 [Leptospiraceae bacterium]|nr:hypothetical protein [Leptospiraceae bacterium]
MGNIFRLNSLFEYEIALFPKILELNKKLKSTNASLEYLFIPIADKSDFVLISENISTELLEYWKSKQIHHANCVYINQIQDSFSLNEWGNTSCIQDSKLVYDKDIIKDSRYFNSKVNQCIIKSKLGINPFQAKVIHSSEELLDFMKKDRLPYVIKYEFGFSGRNKNLIKNLENYNELKGEINWKQNPKLVVEEWLGEYKTSDFSGVFQSNQNVLEFLCITEMLITKEGSYKGSIIKPHKNYSFQKSLIENTKLMFQNLEIPYTGSLSVDGFWYTFQNKEICQYVSEINFRYSMGRILYEFHKSYGRECKEYSLIILSLKNAKLTFQNLTLIFSNVEKNYNCRIFLLTPLHDSEKKVYHFIVIYIEIYGESKTEQIVSVLKKI